MRVAITGTNGVGKTTLLQSILREWECFTTPEETYRDKIKNRYTGKVTAKRQKLIMDHMIHTGQRYGRNDNVLYDRCAVDNMVYSLHAFNNGLVSEKFITKTAERLKGALRNIDLILFIPLTQHDSLDLSETLNGKLTVEYAKEIDFIFKSLYREWEKRESPFVDFEDKPHIIEVFGSPEERLEIARLYIDEDGEAFGGRSIVSPDELDELEKLNELAGMKEKLTEGREKNKLLL